MNAKNITVDRIRREYPHRINADGTGKFGCPVCCGDGRTTDPTYGSKVVGRVNINGGSQDYNVYECLACTVWEAEVDDDDDDELDWANELSQFIDQLLTKHTGWIVEHPAEITDDVAYHTLDCMVVNDAGNNICVRVTFDRII